MTQIRQAHTADTAWHALDTAEVLARMRSSYQGLGSDEAAARLAQHGPNQLLQPKRRSALLRFLRQFHNVLIYMLLAAGFITLLLGHWVDSGVIFGVVFINAVIGHVQEGKAERAMEGIRALLSPTARVVRDGHVLSVPAATLIPGDLVQLQSGDKVPADVRLLRTRELRIEEAALSGESVPVDKAPAPVAAQASLGDRHCMAFSGTLVSSGQGLGVVIATGMDTELGHISGLLAEVPELTTPLLKQMADFGHLLTWIILILAAASFAFGVFLHGKPLDEMFLAAVALAVAAIPEGLPAIITIALAIGVQRMATRHVIIRRLPAVETLGSVSVIATDKTGTLTRNEMTVTGIATAGGYIEVGGAGYAPSGEFRQDNLPLDPDTHGDLLEIVRAGALCNDAHLEERATTWHPHGDPMEAALLCVARKTGLDTERTRAELPRTDAIPFESQHRFMATLHHDRAGHAFVFVKGAPEQVLEMCSRQRLDGEDRPLDPRYWHAHMQAMGERGQRLLAVAYIAAQAEQRSIHFDDVQGGLTLLGLFGLIDPPREEAIHAVAACRAAGIHVKMITGDHAVTAAAIGAQLGIGGGISDGIGEGQRVVTGADIEAMNAEQLRNTVRVASIFARTSPEHKLRLVEALQADRQITAMTGDGVNDAPALKRADIGVAMGINGTEAAKEAAEMVLTDDNFASIVAGVEEGRTVYDNIRKSILFILPTNMAEAMVVVIAIALGDVLPITPVQILWVNMITAVTLALALAFEPAEADIMRRPPRRAREPLLSRFLLWRVGLVSMLIVAGVFWLFSHAQNGGASLAEARTLAVNSLVAGQAVYLFNTRFLYRSSFSWQGLIGNRVVLLTVLLVCAFQVLFTYLPIMQTLFATTPLGIADWLHIGAIALAVYTFVEVEKALLRRFHARSVAD
ncbi:MAG: cation-transporting P-type ATPase [Gammaproteobacteria bacterium]|nr:cation-transporting P-type ATPase [Gammaproteobacteria bacterium]